MIVDLLDQLKRERVPVEGGRQSRRYFSASSGLMKVNERRKSHQNRWWKRLVWRFWSVHFAVFQMSPGRFPGELWIFLLQSQENSPVIFQPLQTQMLFMQVLVVKFLPAGFSVRTARHNSAACLMSTRFCVASAIMLWNRWSRSSNLSLSAAMAFFL